MNLKWKMQLWAIQFAGFVLQWMPLRMLRAFGIFLGTLGFRVAKKKRKFMLANLKIAFPDLSELEHCRIARRSLIHLAWNAIDVFRSAHWTPEQLRDRFAIEGLEHLEKARARGHGVIVLTLHLGNFELGSRVAPLIGVQVTWVGRPISNPFLYDYVTELRTRTGSGLLAKRNIVPTILRELRKGRAVGVLNDQYGQRPRAVYVPFFGINCWTAAGVATVALRTGAPVVPLYVYRDGPDHNQVKVLEPIDPPKGADAKAAVVSATAHYNRVYETIIRQHPEQYWWMTRRYRRCPDVPEDLYR